MQAVRLIRHYEEKVAKELDKHRTGQLMQMIDKEVKVLKGKLSKVIYILLETSFISDN